MIRIHTQPEWESESRLCVPKGRDTDSLCSEKNIPPCFCSKKIPVVGDSEKLFTGRDTSNVPFMSAEWKGGPNKQDGATGC